jgi:phenylalanyl-tRNA synthetase beta chain
MRVALATVGATLPGIEIRQAKVRGIESSGMLCSAKELGIAEDASGLMALPADTPLGVDLRKVLDLDDRLITIKPTPNRGDCLSMLGVAREVAALTGRGCRTNHGSDRDCPGGGGCLSSLFGADFTWPQCACA